MSSARSRSPISSQASTGSGCFARYARRANPLLGELLRPMEYDWVTAQAEYSTDVLFRKRSDLQELMPRLLQYSTL